MPGAAVGCARARAPATDAPESAISGRDERGASTAVGAGGGTAPCGVPGALPTASRRSVASSDALSAGGSSRFRSCSIANMSCTSSRESPTPAGAARLVGCFVASSGPSLLPLCRTCVEAARLISLKDSDSIDASLATGASRDRSVLSRAAVWSVGTPYRSSGPPPSTASDALHGGRPCESREPRNCSIAPRPTDTLSSTAMSDSSLAFSASAASSCASSCCSSSAESPRPPVLI